MEERAVGRGCDALAEGERREKAPRKRNSREKEREREKRKWGARDIKERREGGRGMCGGRVALAHDGVVKNRRIRAKEEEKDFPLRRSGCCGGKNVWLLHVTYGFLRANNNIYETHRCARRAPGSCRLVDKVSIGLSSLKECHVVWDSFIPLSPAPPSRNASECGWKKPTCRIQLISPSDGAEEGEASPSSDKPSPPMIIKIACCSLLISINM